MFSLPSNDEILDDVTVGERLMADLVKRSWRSAKRTVGDRYSLCQPRTSEVAATRMESVLVSTYE